MAYEELIRRLCGGGSWFLLLLVAIVGFTVCHALLTLSKPKSCVKMHFPSGALYLNSAAGDYLVCKSPYLINYYVVEHAGAKLDKP